MNEGIKEGSKEVRKKERKEGRKEGRKKGRNLHVSRYPEECGFDNFHTQHIARGICSTIL
jgi:hypothetical protein